MRGYLNAFDLDGTLLCKNSSFTLSQYLFRKKVLTFADLQFCSACYFAHLYFGYSLIWLHQKIFTRIFYKRNIDRFTPYIEPFLDKYLDKMIYPPAIARLKRHQALGEEVVILSTSPLFLVKAIATRLGVKNVYATQYQCANDGLISSVRVVAGEEKRDFFNGKTLVYAYSDSIWDLPLLQASQKSVAVRPDRKLRKIAKKNNWEIL